MDKKNNQTDSQDKKKTPIGTIIVWSIIGVLVVWSLTFVLYLAISNSDERGQFGDMFGAVNALFSGLAFAGLIITLILQRQELGLQREELEQTREEMKNQRAEFEKENETLKYQRFENLFYNMLNLHQEIVIGLRFDYEEKEPVSFSNGSNYPIQREFRKTRQSVVGRDVFRFTFEEVDMNLSVSGNYGQRLERQGYRLYMNMKGYAAYDDTWIPTRFDHYFRHLYKIIQFVDSQDFPFEEAYKYVSMLRGTLSRYELVWIFYNALNPSFENFKKLIEKYSLLKSLRSDLLTRSLETERYYEGLGIDLQTVFNNGFSAKDFEFFLTDNENEKGKYHISAFWNKKEIQLGRDVLDRWRFFIEKAAEKVVVDKNGGK